MRGVHPLAHVDGGVLIGEGTRVWAHANVVRGAQLGRDCVVGASANLDACRLGDRCHVGHAASLHPGLAAGDEVFFGPGVIVCNDPWPRVRSGDFDLQRLLDGFVCVRIGDRAGIGAGAIVMPGVTIGADAMVAAGAVIEQDIPAWHLHKRNGDLVPIDRREIRRMRAAA